MFSNSTLKSFTGSLKKGNNSDSLGKVIEYKGNSKSMPSILAQDIKIDGEIHSSGVIEIEGSIKGIVKSSSIIIRESGSVEGEINADSINIRGLFSGNIKARNINVFSKAKVTGNIEYCSLSVEDGASIDGQFKQITDQKS
ncbi:MAG: cytoskeletal protein CcmA (bactofilin family) [Rickettsiales bacterium]|jgi:cytoskeletal protein CcmA (bactofilin family)